MSGAEPTDKAVIHCVQSSKCPWGSPRWHLGCKREPSRCMVSRCYRCYKASPGSYAALPSHTIGQSKSQGQSQILIGKPLMKVKEESEKVGLKLNIQKAKTMASGPITSWQIDGETVGNSVRLCFSGLQNHYRR